MNWLVIERIITGSIREHGVPCIHRIGIAGGCIRREISELNFILPAILPVLAVQELLFELAVFTI